MPSAPRVSHLAFLRRLSVFLALPLAVMTTSCGSSGPKQPVFSGNTQVMVALTSTANDELSEFDLVLQSITLTDQSGTTVNLFSVPQGYEFVHLNGQTEPLTSVSIPQNIYTSATAIVGAAQFTCLGLTPDGGLLSDTFAYGYTPNSQVTVTLPAPITITGNSMALSLNLLVTPSVTYPGCDVAEGIPSYLISPTFNLTAAQLASLPTNPENGEVAGLDGQITALGANGNSFSLTVSEGDALPRTVTISTGSGTLYQGVGGLSALSVGTFMVMDGDIQSDGSLLATRIAVEDPSAVDVILGPVMFVSAAEPALAVWGREQQGSDYTDSHVIGAQNFSFDHAVFQISGQLSNLQDLPFVPSFTASNIVSGQNVYLSSPRLIHSSNPYTELDAITLMPQAINGSIIASSPSGHFTDYTVSLASYDLFPTYAVEQGQNTLLTNPSQVEVYVDNNTQQLNGQQLTLGNTFRFYGLVFNDNGTLRMDCAQINDGVTGTSQSTSNIRSQSGESPSTTVRHSRVGSQVLTTTLTQSHASQH
jgi:Domain of unknown function (DUF5666)